VGAVVIGMDPHKRSVTIEVMAGDETVIDGGRFATDVAGYRGLLAFARRFGSRTWAIEGCQGIGHHVATRLIADGESVVDVPPNSQLGCGCSRPARAARPTPPTHIRWLWSQPG
jgi:transposase